MTTRIDDNEIGDCGCEMYICADLMCGCRAENRISNDDLLRSVTNGCGGLLCVAAAVFSLVGSISLLMLHNPTDVSQHWELADSCTVDVATVLPFSARDCGKAFVELHDAAANWCLLNQDVWAWQINGAVASVATPQGIAVACCVNPVLGDLDGYDPMEFAGGREADDLCTCGPNGTSPRPAPSHMNTPAGLAFDEVLRRTLETQKVLLPTWAGEPGHATFNAPPRLICSRSTNCTAFFRDQTPGARCSIQTDTHHKLFQLFAIVGNRTTPYPDLTRRARAHYARVFLIASLCPTLALMCICLSIGRVWCRAKRPRETSTVINT